ncbi:hypothetical protein A9Q86_00715 [Flavobacteriales bacterium 33_180_T64]|nr:hypothetical protein A9Q86_00715 [Flavobacteriales bacterium 33_180_T64]
MAMEDVTIVMMIANQEKTKKKINFLLTLNVFKSPSNFDGLFCIKKSVLIRIGTTLKIFL